jgi:Spy/CpxP family protein refolding chaperone
MTRARSAAALLALVALTPALAVAGPPHGRMGRPEFLDELFPPRLVMRHQSDIGLRPEQREAISKAMTATETRLVEVQWQLEEQSAALRKLLAQPSVDQAAALAQAERVMALEQEMKKAHLALLIQIKNQLDPAQQEKLRPLRAKRRGDRRSTEKSATP